LYIVHIIYTAPQQSSHYSGHGILSGYRITHYMDVIDNKKNKVCERISILNQCHFIDIII